MQISKCLSVLVVLFAVSSAWAGEYFFVTLEFPPIEYTREDGQVDGIAVEMVTSIMRRLGHSVNIRAYPWTRALAMVEEGKADAIFTVYRVSERETVLDYCNQVLLPQVVYFYKKEGSAIKFDGNIEELKGKRIGVVSTISYGSKFDESKIFLRVEKTSQLEHNLQKLLLGRIDLAISNGYTGEYTIRKLGLQGKIVRMPHEVEHVPSYIAFSKKRNLTDLRNQFDQALFELKNSSEYSKVIKKFGLELEK